MKKAWLTLVLGSALFLAACGGNDKDTTAPDNNANKTEDTVNNDVANEGTTTDKGTTNETATGGADEATLAKGEEVVNQSCLSCHGGQLEGKGSFPALNAIGATLSEEQILNVIVNGQGNMPPNIVKGEDAKAAAAYLATLK